MDSPNTTWYYEYIKPDLVQTVGLRRIVHSGRTAYQSAQVLDTGPFGRCLVLDGKTQSSEADEWVYHEGLVQPVMMAHANPRRVFIAGGGEGATAREVLRHKSVTDVVMVDLDREVVDLCKEHLPKHHQGAFQDERLTLLHEDALVYLEQHPEPFDVIVIDIPDPLEGGPAYLLYTEEFYGLVKSRLTPGGLMVAQAGPAGPINVTEVYTAIHRTMANTFPRTHAYRVYMPSFGTVWGFAVGALQDSPDLNAITVDELDRRVAARVDPAGLRYYDGVAHHGMLGLPKYIRAAIAAETRSITRDNPLFAI